MATSFNLGGLLGVGDGLGDLLTPEQQRAVQQRGLLSAAAALLQASGPSRTPTSLGQALGSALLAGQTGAEQAQQSALTQMLTRQKLEEARRVQDLQRSIGQILAPQAAPTTGAITPEDALAATGMAAGPTTARAALIGQERTAVAQPSDQQAQAQRYMRAAEVYMASGRTEDAKRLMDIAQNLAPKPEEVVGEPFQTTTGQWVQRTKTGGIIPLPASAQPVARQEVVGEPFQSTSGQWFQRTKAGTVIPLPAEAIPAVRQDVVGEPFQTSSGQWVQRTRTGDFVPVPAGMEPRVTAKPLGEPLSVTDRASGNQILVQRFDDGTIKPLEGYGPRREVVLQNVDGRVMAIDKSSVAPGTMFGTGISPVDQARLDMEKQSLDMQRRRLNISEAEFARNAYERVETAQGIMYVPKRPGAPVIPLMDATGKPVMGAGGAKPTEGELNAAGFVQRMERASGIVSQLPSAAATGIASSVAGSIPFVGGVAQRAVQSPAQQQYKQAADDWIRAKLRKESGAVIGKEEMDQEYITYFPQVGDSAAVIAQKSEARRVATEAMRTSAGRAYQPYTPPPAQQTQNQPPREGQEAKDTSGRAIVFRNNRWEYK